MLFVDVISLGGERLVVVQRGECLFTDIDPSVRTLLDLISVFSLLYGGLISVFIEDATSALLRWPTRILQVLRSWYMYCLTRYFFHVNGVLLYGFGGLDLGVFL